MYYTKGVRIANHVQHDSALFNLVKAHLTNLYENVLPEGCMILPKQMYNDTLRVVTPVLTNSNTFLFYFCFNKQAVIRLPRVHPP